MIYHRQPKHDFFAISLNSLRSAGFSSVIKSNPIILKLFVIGRTKSSNVISPNGRLSSICSIIVTDQNTTDEKIMIEMSKSEFEQLNEVVTLQMLFFTGLLKQYGEFKRIIELSF